MRTSQIAHTEQLITTLKSDFLAGESQVFADSVLRKYPGPSSRSRFSQRLDLVFRRILDRTPTSAEVEAAKSLASSRSDSRTVWANIVRELFGSAEFCVAD